jgi:septum formation protein
MVECPVPIVLASLSERRQRILREAGYSFTVQDPGEAEDSVAAGAGPEEVACAKARAKAAHVALLLKPSRRVLVVAADTVVALGSQVLGKPLDREDAKRILRRLSGARQQVVTGLCLWPAPDGPGSVVEAVSTLVVMRPMSEGEIADYVASGEADGKAGAYAIQESGDRFVERLEGSFHNVVGFPLERFEELLPELLRKWLGPDRKH